MGRYEEVCAEHEWRVPDRYNIAADVCDKHPRDKLAMVHERYDGETRELTWGELQDLSNQAANLLAAQGVTRGDRVAVVLPPTPETAAIFFGTWKLGALLLSMSVLYGDDGIRHRLEDSQPRVLVTDEANARASMSPSFSARSVAAQSTNFQTADTSCDDPAQLYYTSGTTGLAKGIVHAHRYILGPRGVPLLPRGRGRRALSTAWASGHGPPASRRCSGPWRLGAVQCVYQREGGFDPAQAARLPLAQRGDERLHDADGDALDDVDRRRRHALPVQLPPRLLGGRAAQPRRRSAGSASSTGSRCSTTTG
jgi:acetyl-CoA synthetase